MPVVASLPRVLKMLKLMPRQEDRKQLCLRQHQLTDRETSMEQPVEVGLFLIIQALHIAPSRNTTCLANLSGATQVHGTVLCKACTGIQSPRRPQSCGRACYLGAAFIRRPHANLEWNIMNPCVASSSRYILADMGNRSQSIGDYVTCMHSYL